MVRGGSVVQTDLNAPQVLDGKEEENQGSCGWQTSFDDIRHQGQGLLPPIFVFMAE